MREGKSKFSRITLRRRRHKTLRAIEALEALYGRRRRERGRDPLSSLIMGVLSQNTNDKNRDLAYGRLRERFPRWEDLLQAETKEIARAIRPGGLAQQKSSRIKEFLLWLERERGELSLDFICRMSPEEALEFLGSHKGIGIKTVYVTLLFSCGKDVFPVDTHIHRVSERLGLIPEGSSLLSAHRRMAELVPPGEAYSFHLNLITFGRNICQARRPLHELCPLRRNCDYFRGLRSSR